MHESGVHISACALHRHLLRKIQKLFWKTLEAAASFIVRLCQIFINGILKIISWLKKHKWEIGCSLLGGIAGGTLAATGVLAWPVTACAALGAVFGAFLGWATKSIYRWGKKKKNSKKKLANENERKEKEALERKEGELGVNTETKKDIDDVEPGNEIGRKN